MKNIINLFAVSFIVLSGTMYAATTTTTAPSNIQVQVEKTTIPGGMSTTGSMGATGTMGASGAAAQNVIPGAKDAPFISDHDLAKEIYKAIRDDRTISSDSKIKIIVTVFNGKVTLSGIVVSQAEKDRAELLANQVNKLKGVANDIKVSK